MSSVTGALTGLVVLAGAAALCAMAFQRLRKAYGVASGDEALILHYVRDPATGVFRPA